MPVKNDHTNYKSGDGTIVSDMNFKQTGVGAISIEQFNITYSEQRTGMFYNLRVYDGEGYGTGQGWGKIIFEGSLKDLVEVIKSHPTV